MSICCDSIWAALGNTLRLVSALKLLQLGRKGKDNLADLW